MKNKIALALTVSIFLNLILPLIPVSYADSLSDDTLNKIQNLEAYKTDIFNKNLLFNSSVSIEDIETYLTQYGEKHPLVSRNGEYRLNKFIILNAFPKYVIL